MALLFTKYQGTGNDFILIDNRDKNLHLDKKQIELLCDRKFGVGSDGLILIEPDPNSDFEMVFYNPDGSQSFCGNGSRCAIHFYHQIVSDKKTTYRFKAIDGIHLGEIISESKISVTMTDTKLSRKMKEINGYFMDTGSPHFIQFMDNMNFDIQEKGKNIRNNTDLFGNNGTNVNFVQILEDGSIFVRTYERGVENETLSCGTGVTASGLVYSELKNVNSPVEVKTKGGNLEIEFEEVNNTFKNVKLVGPANSVFTGEIEI